MPVDPRIDKIRDLIIQVFKDSRLTRDQVREILEEIQEECQVRLEALVLGDEKDESC